ncbi:H-type lectin domain-containing protein [Archangium violaceum]|uniref:H-type lectin domain-containing protein n=1 Tax=Archangium violaceum TaxID=83451 RepID=UPI00194F0F63|nr:H-type lectin domain-containing protein [Archangium violaceum]QRN96381.1 H-type lectin domain-containing protein [Archangium violaceum]
MPSKLPLLTTCALLALPAVARSESNPRAISLRIQCPLKDDIQQQRAARQATQDCRLLSGWFEGRLDWRSGGTAGEEDSGTLLFSEFGRFYATHGLDGEIIVYADGNNHSEDFEQRYLTPGEHNVLTAPDLRVVLYLRKRDDYVKLTDQRFMPVASAAWARYAEKALGFTGELTGDVVGPQGSTKVVAIQSVRVSSTLPTTGQELRFDGSQWEPTTTSPLTAGAGLQGGPYDGQSPATFSVVFGTGPGTVTEGSDTRLPPAPGAAGQLLYSNGSKWNALAPGAPAQVLHGGTTPSWGPVSLDKDVSGVLPPARGGTGLASPGAAGNVLRSTGSGWASSPLTGGDVPGGSGNYIQNQASTQQNARMWISGLASVGSLRVGGGTLLQRVQMGSLVLNPPGRCDGFPIIQCNYTWSLAFPSAFSSPPTVIVTPRSGCWNCTDTFNVTTRNVTETGFDLVVTRTDPHHLGADWGQYLQIDFLAGN